MGKNLFTWRKSSLTWVRLWLTREYLLAHKSDRYWRIIEPGWNENLGCFWNAGGIWKGTSKPEIMRKLWKSWTSSSAALLSNKYGCSFTSTWWMFHQDISQMEKNHTVECEMELLAPHYFKQHTSALLQQENSADKHDAHKKI